MAADRPDMSRRKTRLAQLVADGTPLNEAGRAMGLTKGQTSRVWMNIKADLGEQAI